jgi:hypothetical protein
MSKVILNIFNREGVEFDAAFRNGKVVKIQDIEVNLLNISDIKSTKKATGRYIDLNDLENLEVKGK